MSRQTKRAYLRLCPEKRRKKNLVHKGLKLKSLVFYATYYVSLHYKLYPFIYLQHPTGKNKFKQMYVTFHHML